MNFLRSGPLSEHALRRGWPGLKKAFLDIGYPKSVALLHGSPKKQKRKFICNVPHTSLIIPILFSLTPVVRHICIFDLPHCAKHRCALMNTRCYFKRALFILYNVFFSTRFYLQVMILQIALIVKDHYSYVKKDEGL